MREALVGVLAIGVLVVFFAMAIGPVQDVAESNATTHGERPTKVIEKLPDIVVGFGGVILAIAIVAVARKGLRGE